MRILISITDNVSAVMTVPFGVMHRDMIDDYAANLVDRARDTGRGLALMDRFSLLFFPEYRNSIPTQVSDALRIHRERRLPNG